MLSAGLIDLGGEADTDQAVVRLELLHGLGAVVDQGEAGGLSATELRPQTKDIDLVLGGLVEGGQLLAELLLGDVGTAGVQDVTGGRVSVLVLFLLCVSRFPSWPMSSKFVGFLEAADCRDVAFSRPIPTHRVASYPTRPITAASTAPCPRPVKSLVHRVSPVGRRSRRFGWRRR